MNVTSGLTSNDLDAFSRLELLQPNWDSYGAPPIYPTCILEAKVILSALRRGGSIGEWSIVPCSDGGVQLEQHCYGKDVEITINMATQTVPASFSTAK